MDKIDWGKIPEGFDWAATDENGELWAFKYKPEDGFCMWYVGVDKDQIRISGPVVGGYKGGSWRESLQHRPAKEPEIKFGPRPEKLWVGMKGRTRGGNIVKIKEINNIGPHNHAYLRWGDGLLYTSAFGFCDPHNLHNDDIVEWEQPQEAPSEPDYMAGYEQLQQEGADLIDYRESYAELRSAHLQLNERYCRLRNELERTQAELKDVYKDREKLNKIVEIIHGLGDDDATV